MADFLLSVGVDPGLSYVELQKGISDLVSKLNANPPKIKIDFEINSKAVDSAKKQIASLYNTPGKASATNAGINDATKARAIAGEMAKTATQAQNAANATRRLQSELTNASTAVKPLEANSKEFFSILKRIDTLITQINHKQKTWTAAKNGKTSKAYSGFAEEVKTLSELRDSILSGNLTDKKTINDDFAASYSNVAKISKEIKAAGENTKSWGDRVGSLSEKFGTWLSISQVIMAGVRTVKAMIDNVIKLDTAMTELKKVTNETDATYDKFLSNAVTRSKKRGAELTDTVNASASFARLGYNIEDAEKLADAAIVYKNVGDGIADIDIASESIIATMQAFGIAADDVMSIVDKFNDVGNNYAISSKGVGDALLRSAAAMHAANNSLDETIALATAANTVVQDPDKVGTTLKTISMFLRAAKTEAEEAGESTEGMASSVSELRTEILSLTGDKVDIQIDEDTFKSTYQILKEISSVWSSLTDVTQANLVELIGGKRNSNVVSALLENFSVAERSLKTSSSSSGSALEENDKVLESIQGKINILKASFQELSSNLIDGSMLKFIIETGSALLKVLNLCDGLPVKVMEITVALIALGKAKNLLLKTKTASNIINTVSALKELSNAGLSGSAKLFASIFTDVGKGANETVTELLTLQGFSEETAGSLVSLAGGLKSVLTNPLTWIAAVVGAFQLYQKHLENIQKAADEVRENWNTASKDYSKNMDELNGFKIDFDALSPGVDEYGDNVSLAADEYERYKSIVSGILDMSPELIAGFDAEGNAIANKNNLLEKAIELQEKAYREKLWETYNDESLKSLYKAERNNAQSLYDIIAEVRSPYSILNNEVSGVIDKNKLKLLVESPDKFIGMNENALNSSQKDNLKKYANDIKKYYDEYKTANQKFIKDMQSVPQLSAEYNKLSGAQKNTLTELINNLNILDINSVGMAESVRNQIIEITDALSSQDKSSFEVFDRINNLNSSFDKGKVSINEYKNQMDSLNSTQDIAIDSLTNLLRERKDLAKALGADENLDGTITNEEIEKIIRVNFKIEQDDVLKNFNDIVSSAINEFNSTNNTTGANALSGIDLSTAFGNFTKPQINEISTMLASSNKSTAEQAQILATLAKSISAFDGLTNNGLTRILTELDRSDPNSISKYNAEIENFFDTLRTNPQTNGLTDVIDTLEDVLGNATQQLADFETGYAEFLSLAENDGITAGQSATSKAVEILKSGLEDGLVNSKLFNESLNLLFGNKRPKDLENTLGQIGNLFGLEGEDEDDSAAVERMYSELNKYTENGIINFQKLREELSLSDAAFNALTEKMRDAGLLLANQNDMNLIGDGLGISNDKVLNFENEASEIVNQFKDGSLTLAEYSKKVEDLANKYGLAKDAMIDFKRNMYVAGTDDYRIADDNGFGGSMTAFLGVGGDVAQAIELEIKNAQQAVRNNNFDPSTLLDTNSLMDSIRQKLRETGEYTENQIEEMVSKLNGRVYQVRINESIEAQLNDIDFVQNELDEEAQKQLKEAVLNGFNTQTGTFDIGKIKANISSLEFVTNGNLNADDIMQQLGFKTDDQGNWTSEGATKLGSFVMNLSTDSAAQNMQAILSQVQNIQDILNNLQNNPTTIAPNHSELASAEGQAISTRNTLQEMTAGYTIPVTIEQTGSIPVINAPQNSASTEGDREANGGIINSKDKYLVNDGKKRGTELIMRADGTYGYVENNGLPGIVHLNKDDVVFNEDDTEKIRNNRYINLGKRFASGRLPKSTGIKTLSQSSKSSSGSDNKTDSKAENKNLDHLKKSIQDTEAELDRLSSKIDAFQNLLDMSDDTAFEDKLYAYSNMLSLSTERAAGLYDEFERLRDIVPQSSEEASELSSRMEKLGDEIISNAKKITEYSKALNMVRVDAVKNQVENLDSQIDESDKLLERNIKNLTEHTLTGRSGVFDTSFLIPSLSESAVEKKRKENRELLDLEIWLQEEIYEIKKRYREMEFAENSEASSKSSSKSTSGGSSTNNYSGTSSSIKESGSFEMVDVTNYDSLVANTRSVLAAKISEMVSQFTSNDWQQITRDNPLSAFVLDDSSWNELNKQISEILSATQSNQDIKSVSVTDIFQDAASSLVSDTLNTDTSSWTNLTDSVREYIQNTYSLTQEDWETLCMTSPLIAASLKLTGDNSWDARNTQLNGAGGIVPGMMGNSMQVVATTILPTPQFNQTSYHNLGNQMGNTIASAITSVINSLKLETPGFIYNGGIMREGSDAGMVGSSSSASSIIAAAMHEVNTNGGQMSENNRYTNGIAEAWCGDFVDYCAKLAGIKAPLQRSVINGASSMASLGLYRSSTSGYVPQPGDFIYFDWAGAGGNASLGALDHVGIVESFDSVSGVVNTIEGNTSGSSLMRKRRTLSSNQIAGYGITSSLPRYEAGTDGALGGNALVGEKGRELAIFPNGQVVILGRNGAEIVDIPPMTQILPNDDTETVLKYTGDKIDKRVIPKYANGTNHKSIKAGSGVTAEAIDSLIRKYCGSSSVLKPGDGKYFIEAQNASGIDALVLFAIASHESAYGTSQIAHDKNNLYGYGAYDSSPYASAYGYNGLEAGIVEIAKKIGKYYVNERGQDTLYKIEHDPDGTGFRYASDQQWDTKVSGHLEKFMDDLGITMGENGFTAAVNNNTSALNAATDTAKDATKTISTKISELTKPSSSYSSEFIDGYMNYVSQRKSMFNTAKEARKFGEFEEADAIDTSLNIRDIEETFAMQLDLYSESAKAYQKNYEELEALYYEAVNSGADTEVLSEIIDAMSEVSSKIDDVSDKWQSAIEAMGDAFTSIIDRITAQVRETATWADRNLINLEHMLNVTDNSDVRREIYSAIGYQQDRKIDSSRSIMDVAQQTAEYQRGQRNDIPALGKVILREYAASQGQKVRSNNSDVIGSFGNYEQWFNSDGTINLEVFSKSIENFDDDMKQRAISFANDLSSYKVLYNNDIAQQFGDIMANHSVDEIHTWFDGNGNITQAAYDMLDSITDESYKNRLMLFMTFQSAVKKIYYKNQEEIFSNIEARYDTWQALVDNANEALDGIQNVYSTLMDAAQEYGDSGFINPDTLQSILDLGVKYLAMLEDENGQLVINEDNINKIIKARIQQVGIENALNYVQRLRTAITNNDTAALNDLLTVTDGLVESNWDLVYAELASLNLNEEQYNIAVKRIDAIRALSDSAIKGVGQVGDQVIDGLNKSSEALSSILDYVISMIKQEKDDEIEAIREEVSEYQKIINLQKESLRLTKESESYNRTVSDKLKDIAELEQQISRLSLDDSREAQAEKKSLEEELAELQTDLADYQADHAYEATVDSLDKMSEAFEEEKNGEIEIIEDSISSYQKLYDLAIERVKSSGSGLLDELLTWNEQYGNDLNETIVEAWDNASEALEKYNYNLDKAIHKTNLAIENSSEGNNRVVGNTFTSGSTQSSTRNEAVNSIVSKMKANSAAWATSSDQTGLAEENQKLGNSLKGYGVNAIYDDKSGRWYIGTIGGKLLYDEYPKYHRGGIVGKDKSFKDNEVLSVLENGELVLDKQKKKSLYEFIDISTYMTERFGASVKSINGILSSSRQLIDKRFDLFHKNASDCLPTTNNNSGCIINKLEVTAPIQVSEKLDKSDIDEFQERIGAISAQKIKRGFGRRNS